MSVKPLMILTAILLFSFTVNASTIDVINPETPSIEVVSQSGLDKFIIYEFTSVKEDYSQWLVNWKFDDKLLDDINGCLALSSAATDTCLAEQKGKYVTDYKDDFNADAKKLDAYPVKSAAAKIKVNRDTINMNERKGTFVLDFPLGFEKGLEAKFGFHSTIINTTTATDATNYMQQRKTFYAAGRFWVFYRGSNNNFSYTTSSDGTTWTQSLQVSSRGLSGGERMSVYYDQVNNSVHYVFVDANNRLMFRKGTPMPNGSIEWYTVEQTLSTTSSVPSYISLVTNSSGNAFISYTINKSEWITANDLINGTWSTTANFPYNISGVDSFASVLPLTGGRVMAIFKANGSIQYSIWGGSAWGTITNTTIIPNAFFTPAQISATSLNDNVYLSYAYSSNKSIQYIFFNNVTWSQPVIVASQGANEYVGLSPSGSLSVLNNGTVYIFWGNNTDNVLHYKFSENNGTTWSVMQNWTNQSADTLKSPDNNVNAFQNQFSDFIGVVYLTNSSSPYKVVFDFVNLSSGIPPNPSKNLSYFCYNGGWNDLNSNSNEPFFEEGIYFAITNSTTNPAPSDVWDSGVKTFYNVVLGFVLLLIIVVLVINMSSGGVGSLEDFIVIAVGIAVIVLMGMPMLTNLYTPSVHTITTSNSTNFTESGIYGYTGWSLSNFGNATDGNWSTNTTTLEDGQLFINYTKPTGTTDVNWQIKDNSTERNITLPAGCLISPIQLKVGST